MVSLLSILEIQGNETSVDLFKDKESKKYGYAIIHNKDKYGRPIISCEPIYDSRKKALAMGTELMENIKTFDLKAYRKKFN
ncbi:hypothetical protein HOC99_05300 [Candidatus Woesearchaeota archaeon]|jgi:hypothetical protein|nr:hypothetical protein [Candidatus Woesearchaeota archaeon]MBT4388056.1 hypothetical protein [Candidatus Woesearchaeota archaeon]MBT4596321.1 hypothetical protein [Candidatus Woesearchaeota archaeon]MBT5740823.1 hypothetical protein [Candidatus Woesearchaeota archaeon]MBT7296540.1 hypothetical protein [Candidatus Woesearchaeota archaeon]